MLVAALAPLRRAGQRLIGRGRGRWWGRRVEGWHDRVGRVVRHVVDPQPHPEVAQAERAFAGAKLPDEGSPRVLVMSQRAWAGQTAFEATLAAALGLRGAEVHLLTCGGDLPACEMGRPRVDRPSPCRHCSGYQRSFLRLLGRPIHTQRAHLDDAEAARIDAAVASTHSLAHFEWDGLPVGRLVRPAVAWTIRDQRIEEAGRDAEIYRDFAAAGARMATAAARMLERVRPDVVIALNGTFMEERIVAEQARRRGIRVVTYEAGPERNTWFFSESSPACEYDMRALWASVGDDALSDAQERELDAVLHRRRGSASDAARVRRDLGIGDERLVAAFSNVGWDTGAFERGVAYLDDLDWLEDILEHARRTDAHFVVRVHPGETPLRPREPLADALRRAYDIPANVTVIGADEMCNSYSLAEASDLVAVYSSTIGMEAAAMGKPVLVGARTHYRGRGFTWDVESPSDLGEWIARPPVMTNDRLRSARRYAHLFFVSGLLRLPGVVIDGADVRLGYSTIDELAPGQSSTLDLVCAALLDPSRRFPVTERAG